MPRRNLYQNLTDEQLTEICDLISSGCASVEAAFGRIARCSRLSVYRSRQIGSAAEAKFEEGAELTEDEARAHDFMMRLREAESARHVILTKHALGYRADGTRSARDESRNAMVILQLTSAEFRTPYRTPEEIEFETPKAEPAVTDESLIEGIQRIKATRPDLLAAAGLRPVGEAE